MASTTQFLVAPGVSARFVRGADGRRLSALERGEELHIRPLPVPAELETTRFPSCDEAVYFVRRYLGAGRR